MPRGVPRKWRVTVMLQSGRAHAVVFPRQLEAKNEYDRLRAAFDPAAQTPGVVISSDGEGFGWIVLASQIESIQWGEATTR